VSERKTTTITAQVAATPLLIRELVHLPRKVMISAARQKIGG